MKQQFNKKKFWTIVALLALVETLVLFCVFQWRYIFPSHEVSDLYTHYEKVDGIDASFIKDFRVNDSVFVDVTLLEATDSAGWSILKKDFEVPTLPLELQQLIDNGEDLIFTKSIPKSEIDALGVPNDLLAISHLTYTLTVFHIGNATEKHAIMRQNYKRTIYQ